MLGWRVWEGDKDIQVIPDGEENNHYFDVKCGCYPRNSTTLQGVPMVIHNSFDGREIFEVCNDSPFHRIRQTRDC